MLTIKKEFTQIYQENITREGHVQLLSYLERSDFFQAPASSRYHNSFEGGLAQHSINVYHCLKNYLERERCRELYRLSYSDETIALVALLHDVCKIDSYKKDTRNVKNEQGVWEKVPYYRYEDSLPYGHGEKSVYMLSGFMRLTREESMAIRWHMGFSGIEDKNTIGNALERYPLAFALSVADMESTYFMEEIGAK